LRERGVDCLPVIAPRHPERAPAVAALCRARGWRPLLRSAAAAGAPPASLLILDSIGELPALYGHAQLVFLGGSLVPAGGHNPIEAALWGVPVLCGPHVDNFAWINRALAEAGALLTVASGQALGESLLELLAVPQRRAAMGAAAREAVRKQRGATRHLLRALSPLL